MAQIAEHAGVGVGTVYRHFRSREDLLGALVYGLISLFALPGPLLSFLGRNSWTRR